MAVGGVCKLKTYRYYLHKDIISNGRCVVIGEIYGTNNVKRASKEIVDATTQMSSQQVVNKVVYKSPHRLVKQ